MKIALATEPDELFYYREFDSKDKPHSGKNMDSTLLAKLTTMQMLLGYNLKINSGFRTHSRNAQAGGVSNSAHLEGNAVDIRALTNEQRYDIVKQAILLNFKRIGIHKRFIHLDVDSTKHEGIIWMY